MTVRRRPALDRFLLFLETVGLMLHRNTEALSPVGIVGYGLYLPDKWMTAEAVAEATEGRWSAQAIRDKLGFHRKPVPGPEDGTQEMAVRAALDCLERCDYDPTRIDLIVCVGEEHKEYPLTTSGIYVQEKIGATRAWAIDVQQRCNSTVAALKLGKSVIQADDEVNSILIVGGYRNGDLIDYRDAPASFMFNLGAGAGAFLIEGGREENLLLGAHIVTDGSMARDTGVRYGGTVQPIESLPEEVLTELQKRGNQSLTVFDPDHMKSRLEEVSMRNWLLCLDRALEKSGATRSDIGYLNLLHFKRSMHHALLGELGLTDEQSVYLEDYGHLGHVDQMLSLDLGLAQGRVRAGELMVMLSAGIGYVWGAQVVRWG
ncbi:MAG: 3-oxoacyl-ACP synthase [Myxococcota bacterium]